MVAGRSASYRRPLPAARWSRGLYEPPYEGECRVGDLAPAAVDHECVTPVGQLDDLGHALVALLLVVDAFCHRTWGGVVLLARDDQQRPAVRVLRVDLDLGPPYATAWSAS